MKGRMLALGALLISLSTVGSAQQRGVSIKDTSLTGGDDSAGYERVLPSTRLSFPKDYGRHDGFRLEWWYITANLKTETGEDIGIQWTLFRNALKPPLKAGEEKPKTQSVWSSSHVWMAHAAVTTGSDHFFEERFARGGAGDAGVQLASDGQFDAWLGDWQLVGEAGSRYQLKASGKGFSYDLTLTQEGPEVLQGDKGYSVKSSDGQASHYFSQPFLTISGKINVLGKIKTVSGKTWLDREWSSQFLSESQSGWDWFALRLGDDTMMTVARVRGTEGADYVFASLASSKGVKAVGDVTLSPENTPKGKAPTRWRLESREENISIAITALNESSWNRGLFPYFEGPVRFSGSHEGVGYLEMTGYQPPALTK